MGWADKKSKELENSGVLLMNLILSLLVSVVFVFSSLLTQSQLELLWGHQNDVPLYINLFSFIGISLGIVLTKEIGKRTISGLLLFTGTCVILFGINYEDYILNGAQGGEAKHLLVLLFFSLLMVIGFFQQKLFYLNQVFESRYYSLIHIMMALLIPCLLFFVKTFGIDILISVQGAVLLIIAAKIIGDKREVLRFQSKQVRNQMNLNTLIWGICSSVYLGIFFEVSSQIYRSTGIEYPLYLMIVFFAISFSPIIIKYVSTTRKVLVGLLFSTFTIFIVLILSNFFHLQEVFRLDFVKTYSSVFLTFIFLIPYFLLATIIPLSEKKSPSGGHLLSCTVGNICGILIYIVVLKRLDLSLQLIFFLISLGYLMWQEEEIKYKRLIYGAVLAFIVILLGGSLDRKISIFSLQYLADYNGDFDFDTFLRKEGHVGYLVTNPLTRRRHLGLGGYHVKYDTLKEIQQVLWVNEVKKEAFESALVLGLGGHQALATLVHLNEGKNAKNWQVDIVDNNPIFMDLNFRERLAQDSQITWNNEHLNLINEDAFTFVFKNRKKYDVIIWNLSWPIANSTGKLYTSEFVKRLDMSLAPRGVMVGYIDTVFFDQESLYCLFQNSTSHFLALPGLAANIVWISANEPINIDRKFALSFFKCENSKIPKLVAPYSEVVLSLDKALYNSNGAFYKNDLKKSLWLTQLGEIPLPLRLTRAHIFSEKSSGPLRLKEANLGTILEDRITRLLAK